MSLYPLTEFDVLGGTAMFAIPSGCLLYAPFEITTGATALFSLAQIAPTQDFSMKMWFSTEPDGISLGLGFNEAWNLSRTAQLYAVYEQTALPPVAVHALPVDPGLYILNVLNLVNSENMFSFSQTGLS